MRRSREESAIDTATPSPLRPPRTPPALSRADIGGTPSPPNVPLYRLKVAHRNSRRTRSGFIFDYYATPQGRADATGRATQRTRASRDIIYGNGVAAAPMASKVLVPAAPFAKLQVKKSPPEATGSGFFVSGDAAARVAHLEHSVRFLQEQHRLMLSGLHAEIEALRERNRDLQFQLIFNKDTSPKTNPPAGEETAENSEETHLRAEVCRLEREAAAARGEARAAEARALQLQRLLDAQAERLRSLESRASCAGCSGSAGAAGATGVSGVAGVAGGGGAAPAGGGAEGGPESRGELRARLADAERLVRRLRSDAERQRREVHGGAAAAGGAVTNLLFDGAAATQAHLQCMKSSLHASLRAGGVLDNFGFQNTYHFPALQDFWAEPVREEAPRGARRRPLALPELAPHRATIFANAHARGRGYGYEKSKKQPIGDAANKPPEEPQVCANGAGSTGGGGGGGGGEARPRQRRHHHRKHTTDHT
ncbi:unnamed protein product, partial [Iphiclides podalirius]